MNFHPAPHALEPYACTHGWQNGGGLIIYGPYGTATLDNTSVYDNEAYDSVRLLSATTRPLHNLHSRFVTLLCCVRTRFAPFGRVEESTFMAHSL